MVPSLEPLSPVRRVLVSALRPLVRALFVRPALCRLVGARVRRDLVDGEAPDLVIAALVAVQRVHNATDPTGLSPQVARLRMAEGVALVDGDAPSGVRTHDRAYPGPAGPSRARIYEPDGLEALAPGLLYVHGGGFMTCDVTTHDVFCRRLALGARARVVSVEYRLAPEHPMPAAIDDVLAAWRWFLDESASLGVDRVRAGVGGDSAGGHLSALVAQRLRGTPDAPTVQLLVYPALDATCGTPSHRSLGDGWVLTSRSLEQFYAGYVGPDRARRSAPDASPLAAPDLRGVARALVYTAHFDPLRDEGEAYARRLQSAGVRAHAHRFAGLIHGFVQMTGISSVARDACERIAEDVGAALRDPSRVG